MTGERILIVDDEPAIRFGVREFLLASGYAVEEADSVSSALALLRTSVPDALIVDYNLGDGTGLDVMRRAREIDAQVPVVMLTAHGTIDLAVQAIKEGAEQFLTKPVELPALAVILARALQRERGRKKGLARKKKEQREQIDPFEGRSAAIQRLAEDARRLLPTDRPIFINGETGTGKGVLAHWIHDHGPRADEPFVDLNCAGLSRDLLESELFGHQRGAFTGAVAPKAGLLEIAHRGTLFLDEIGDMEPLVQAKLLKVLEDKRYRRMGDLQDRHVDVRLVSATHHDLERLVEEGRFRQDLYYRIGTLPLVVPPLRERREDIGMLARAFATGFAQELGRGELSLTDDAVRLLEDLRWPGNVRELRNAVERAVLLSDGGAIDATVLQFLVRGRSSGAVEPAPTPTRASTPTVPLTLADMERDFIARTLREEGGHVEQAARRLGIPRSSLYYKLKRLSSKE